MKPLQLVPPAWSIAARILVPLLLLALVAAAVWGYGVRERRVGREEGRSEAREEWRSAIDEANMRAAQAGHRYEEWKMRQAPRLVTITKEVSRALEAAPDWRDARLPDGVRDALERAAADLAAGEPDAALRSVPAAPGDVEW
jgi:hypothetical protein